MGITQTTPMAEIDSYIEEQIERTKKALIRYFDYVGEKCLNAARDTNSYKDQTGNLRSSLGYVVIADGKIVRRSKTQVFKNGEEGDKNGIRYAKEMAQKYPEGIVLVVTAGMNYAAHVADKGYDVLDSAELLAERLVPAILKVIGFKN